MKRIFTQILFILIFTNGMSQGINFYDKINFEETCNYLLIDTSSSNLWQIGTPGKSFFDSAYSTPYAIVTDTLNPYTTNNHSSFILKLPLESFSGCVTEITFWHKFETDTLNDYGVVEVSYDEGINWIDLCTDTTYSIYFERNGSGNVNHLVTGQFNEWNIDYILFWWYLAAGPPDNIWLRFSFYTDSIQDGYEGWLIDDIEITSSWWYNISEMSVFNSTPYPNPCKDYLNITIPEFNNQNLVFYLYDIYGRIVETKRYFNNRIVLNTTKHKNGTYLYKIINLDDLSISQGKFIIRK